MTVTGGRSTFYVLRFTFCVLGSSLEHENDESRTTNNDERRTAHDERQR